MTEHNLSALPEEVGSNSEFSSGPYAPRISGRNAGHLADLYGCVLRDDGTWDRPSIPVSGPHQISKAHPHGEELARVLNIRHVNDTIGSATGLKMCFASLSKGFTALAIQSFTTAQGLGVLDELRQHLDDFSPGARTRAEKGLVSMPPKAYRWVNEMDEIAATFEADGGFSADESPFRGIAKIFELVAHGTNLGKEKVENRQRGKNAEDVAKLMLAGTERRKVQTNSLLRPVSRDDIDLAR